MRTFLRAMRRITRLQKLLAVWRVFCVLRFAMLCAQTALPMIAKKQKG